MTLFGQENFRMLRPKGKAAYRLLIACIAMLSLIALAASYVSHTINAYYSKEQPHKVDFVWITLFAVLFIGLLCEFIRLRYLFSQRKKEDEGRA